MDAYQILSNRHKEGQSLRYRRILEFLLTPIQAQIAAQLPASPEEIAEKLSLSSQQVSSEIEDLFRKGAVFPKNYETMENARFARGTEQLHDATQASYTADKFYGKQLYDLWEDFMQNEWYEQYAREFEKLEECNERVLPAYKSIEGMSGVTQWDDVREIFKAAPLIAVVPCSCRKQAGKTDMILDSCFQFERAAKYVIARGSGRQVSLEEALQIVDQVEEDGEVHIWMNLRGLFRPVMCNCTADACLSWTPVRKYDVGWARGGTAKSRFEVEIDQDECTGCKVCVKRCQFDAITMKPVPGSKKQKAYVDPQKCYGCGVCVLKCKPKCMSMKLVRPLDHIPEDRPDELGYWTQHYAFPKAQKDKGEASSGNTTG